MTAGTTCTLDHVDVSGSVTVQSGATLVTRTARIGRDVTGTDAHGFSMSGGSIALAR